MSIEIQRGDLTASVRGRVTRTEEPATGRLYLVVRLPEVDADTRRLAAAPPGPTTARLDDGVVLELVDAEILLLDRAVVVSGTTRFVRAEALRPV